MQREHATFYVQLWEKRRYILHFQWLDLVGVDVAGVEIVDVDVITYAWSVVRRYGLEASLYLEFR